MPLNPAATRAPFKNGLSLQVTLIASSLELTGFLGEKWRRNKLNTTLVFDFELKQSGSVHSLHDDVINTYHRKDITYGN